MDVRPFALVLFANGWPLSRDITYLVTTSHAYTMNAFLDDWEPGLKSAIEVRTYDEIFAASDMRFSRVTIFSDLDRLPRPAFRKAIELADRISLGGGTVLNHPSRFVDRKSLLRRLKRSGFNNFDAFGLGDLLTAGTLRFPVFLRGNSGHDGSLGGLLASRTALVPKLLYQAMRFTVRRISLSDLIVVEKEETVDQATGVYRKYSYLKIGKTMLPRHILYGRSWMVKYREIEQPEFDREEDDFISSKTFLDVIDPVFDIAGIDYGRIDFSISSSMKTVQVWEINTNPNLFPRLDEIPANRRAFQSTISEKIRSGLLAL